MTPDVPVPPELTSWPHWIYKSQRTRRVLAAQVIWVLKLEGPLDGRGAMDRLDERLRRRGVDLSRVSRLALSNLTAVLAHQGAGSSHGTLIEMPVLRRVVHGRRTIHLSVIPRATLPPNPFEAEPVEADEPPAAVEVEPPAPPEPVIPEPEPVAMVPSSNGRGDMPMTTAPIALEDKAMLVLRLASEVALDIAALPVMSSGGGERLAEALAESDRLRQRVGEEVERRRQAEEQLASQVRVSAALKNQNAVLQNNLDAKMRYERRPDESGKRVLDRMMREPIRTR
jgi:hypothetical protein